MQLRRHRVHCATMILAAAELTQIIDALVRLGQVYAWPILALIVLVVFGSRISKVVDQLLSRMGAAQRLKIAGFWEDELSETMKKLVSSNTHERPPIVHNESLTESVTAQDELKDEVVEP